MILIKQNILASKENFQKSKLNFLKWNSSLWIYILMLNSKDKGFTTWRDTYREIS